MGEDEYQKENPNIISEESDEEVEEEYDMTTEDDTNEKDVIVFKPSNNEDYKEITSATRVGIIKKIPPVRNITCTHISSEYRYRQEY